MRARQLLGAAAVAALTACSGGELPVQTAPPAGGEGQSEPSVCPITGRRPPPGVDLDRPAVAVKIENSREARPQSGLENADVVYEEIVEGGITRFLAVYHCGDSDRAGPVRSARYDDPKIAKPFTRILGFSGSNRIVQRELRRRRMIALTELTSGAFYRVPPGNRDIHSLFVDVSKLRAAVRRRKLGPPRTVFAFGPVPRGASAARSATIHFNASNEIRYRFRGGLWRRWEGGEPFRTKRGRQIAVPNVVIQQVDVSNSRTIVDPAGNPSPDIALVGRGRAWLLRNGRALEGRWRIPRRGAPATFTTRRGARFAFARGPIWVELVPSRKGAVRGSVAIR